MTESGPPGRPPTDGANPLATYDGNLEDFPEGRDRGGRRRKLAGYLKAANELRQTYQQNYTGRGQSLAGSEDDQGIPGAFPDVAIVRSGDEEMLLFPGYARRHIKRIALPEEPNKVPSQAPNERQGRQAATSEDADYWRDEWKKHEDDKAIVDVDIRGWIYAPHRGAVSRKNRLMIALARRLSGIPAPPNEQGYGGEVSDHPQNHEERAKARAARFEEQLVAQEAEQILKKGKGEADVADRGGYSEDTRQASDNTSIYSKDSRDSSPDSTKARDLPSAPAHHPLKTSSLASEQDDSSADADGAPGPGHLSKRATWNQPADMSPKELATANTHLMARLKPFLTDPVVNAPVTVFFFNDETSQSRTVVTNDSGHFSLRAVLDFVPSNVRVLASETLSATEVVKITEPTGVSLISDIDDTIKHSAVSSGAKEIFRNTFIRELKDLTIDGVQTWYKRLADMGVQLHYVSNSPWQLYPVLVSYFAMVGLPPGSFHLKQYSGMLQGIFEPVAERKKGTLSRILQDFPERKFILVGDSGEADLEVYTDIVLANPGRIIGVYIRDITTPVKKGFFDSAMGPLSEERKGNAASDQKSSSQKAGSTRESEVVRKPVLSPRTSSPVSSEPPTTGPRMGQLIDFGGDDGETSSTRSQPPEPSPSAARLADFPTAHSDGRDISPTPLTNTRSPGPQRPPKPQRLRSGSSIDANSPYSPNEPTTLDTLAKKRRPPPLPGKPRRYSSNKIPPSQRPLPPSHSASSTSVASGVSTRQSYLPTNVRQKVASAFNKLPSASAVVHGISREEALTRPQPSTHNSTPSTTSSTASSQAAAAVSPALRRGLTAYPVAAAHYATNRISGAWNGTNSDGSATDPTVGSGLNANTTAATAINKKEELWKRRWARAKEVLGSKGVRLRSWRVGSDVMDDAVGLVKRQMEETQKRVEKK